MDIQIRLDEKSKEILSKVDALHRESLINYGIRLLQDSANFKILTGEITEPSKTLDDLSIEEDEEELKSKVEKPKEKAKPKMAIDW